MQIQRWHVLVPPAVILAAAAVYWFFSYEPAGAVMLFVFGIAMGLLGYILAPTIPNAGHTAPVTAEPEPGPDQPLHDAERGDTERAAGPEAAGAQAGSRTVGAGAERYEVEVNIQRFNPEQDDEPHWETYAVEAEPSDRVLDLLHQVKWTIDGTLTFRRSCAHGVCGSDAMMINGRNRLACEYLVKDAGRSISVEPIRGIPVLKDLLVDMGPFWDKYRAVQPFLMNAELPADGRERRQSPAERERYDDTSKCILCAACTTACPVFWTNEDYVGPAAIVNAHRFIFDSRDHGQHERLQIMAEADGVWRCRTIFNCVEACPRGINITGAILEVTQEIQNQRIS